ncbi:unnamed protein product [Meganyctiphanes norvegica]|uniref:aralkylamine N-acetyltransferase n=1 Tax=Meganyctiphanes norvegica TaxID=48144 RepID=A0AAV2QDU5_MEGNR
MSEFDVVVLSLESDEEEVVKVFTESFLTREPTGLGLSATPSDLLDFFLPVVNVCLKSGMSLGAKDKVSGKLVGLMLNKVLTPADKSTFDGHVTVVENNKKVASFQSIFTEVENVVDIFEKFNVQKVLELALLSVHENQSGKGIGKILIERSEELGVNNGCELVNVQATNPITHAICSKRGYSTYLTYDFAKNKDIDLNKTQGSKGWFMMAKKL